MRPPSPSKPSSQRSLLGFRHYQLYLSLRYLKSRFSALAALAAVTFGVGVILILLGMMGGYMEKLRELIRGQESHLIVVGPEPYSIVRVARLERLMRSIDNVRATAPFIEALAIYRSSKFSPCQLRGIQPAEQTQVSNLGQYVLRPEELAEILKDLGVEDERPEQPLRFSDPKVKLAIDRVLDDPCRVALGADELGRFFERGFAFELLKNRNAVMLPELEGRIPPAVLVGIQLLLDREVLLGQLLTIVTVKPDSGQPSSGHFVVAGAFKTGDFELDSKALYTHVDSLKNMLDLFDPMLNSSRYEGVRVALRDPELLQETKAKIEEVLRVNPPYEGLYVRTWEELRRNLLEAVSVEKFVNYFLLVFLLLFASVMILLMLTLTVIEKMRDIGILLALGATPQGVTRIFLTNGLVLTLAGTALGLALGSFFCYFINPIHDWIYVQTGLRLFDPEIYHMDSIPISIRISDVLLSIAPPVVFGFIASLVPALWASRRDPIKAIHYE